MAKLAERQTDLEELVTGPPVSAAFGPDGEPDAGGRRVREEIRRRGGGARAHRDAEGHVPRATALHQRGKATVDVLPDVLDGLLRDLTFPKQMHWDA